MIQINLLEEEKRRAKVRPKIDPTKPLVYMGLILVVGAVLLVDVNMYAKVSALRRERRRHEDSRKQVSHLHDLQRAQELEKRQETLNKKQVIIDDLIRHRIDWSRKLGALRDQLPEDIWIERISLKNPTNPRITYQTLTIDAATMRREHGLFQIAKTMESLGESEHFMAGFDGDLSDVQGRDEIWEKGSDEGAGAQRIWRFTIQAKRPLPASELPRKK